MLQNVEKDKSFVYLHVSDLHDHSQFRSCVTLGWNTTREDFKIVPAILSIPASGALSYAHKGGGGGGEATIDPAASTVLT